MHSEVELTVISYLYMGLLDNIRRHVEQDPWIVSKVNELSLYTDGTSTSLAKCHFDNGFLKYKGRIVLSPTSCWRDKVLFLHHCMPVAGHSGFLKIYKIVSRSFY